MTKQRRKNPNIQYTIRTDSQSMAKLLLWGIVTGAIFVTAVSLLLLPPLQSMPGNEQKWQTMKNATGTYNIQYVPTTNEILTGLGNVLIGVLASFGALFIAYIYRPSIKMRSTRDKSVAALVDLAIDEESR